MSNHTPGPWKIIRGSDYTAEPDDTTILSIDGSDGTTVLSTDSGYYAPSDANARLIAAAPKMYAFIREVAQGGDTPFELDAQILIKEIGNE